jgi:hypothetical protein
MSRPVRSLPKRDTSNDVRMLVRAHATCTKAATKAWERSILEAGGTGS